MLRKLLKPITTVLIISGATWFTFYYRSSHSLEARLEQEHQRAVELEQVVARLTSERRVADVIVTEQHAVGNTLSTSVIFVEYGRNGASLPARHFTLTGKMVHLDAMVIKFDGKYVTENDQFRGRSLALFTRIYGDATAPNQGAAIDSPGEVPDAYRSNSGTVGPFEQQLWQSFWRLADDEAYRNSLGVRVAQGEGVWRPFEPGKLYTITLETAGGLNITSEPLKPIFLEALRDKGVVPQASLHSEQ